MALVMRSEAFKGLEASARRRALDFINEGGLDVVSVTVTPYASDGSVIIAVWYWNRE